MERRLKPVRFRKYHGLGNDFVLMDSTRGGRPVSAAEAVRLCDRHRGIGADGVLTLLPSKKAAFRMHIRNADGGTAEMCGNGLRCAVKHAVEHGGVLAEGGSAAGEELLSTGLKVPRNVKVRALCVETGRGVLRCLALMRQKRVDAVAVNMGAPVLERPLIPMRGRGRFLQGRVRAGGRTFTASVVGMGNPHLVVFGGRAGDAGRFGPLLELSGMFPNRTNVEFARLTGPREIAVEVWERGAGLTLACGTGACATAAAFALAGLVPFDSGITVRLPGGPLQISVPSRLDAVYMCGPAAEVFKGTVRAGWT
jgi:diaminopimelate epimerase